MNILPINYHVDISWLPHFSRLFRNFNKGFFLNTVCTVAAKKTQVATQHFNFTKDLLYLPKSILCLRSKNCWCQWWSHKSLIGSNSRQDRPRPWWVVKVLSNEEIAIKHIFLEKVRSCVFGELSKTSECHNTHFSLFKIWDT